MAKELTRKQCPNCLDEGSDNLVIYETYTYCYSCNKVNPVELTSNILINEQDIIKESINTVDRAKNFLLGECRALRSRGISQEVCSFMDYQVGKYSGTIGSGGAKRVANNEWVQIANYYDISGRIKNFQHIRSQYKEFLSFGEKGKQPLLYGQWKWTPNKNLFCIVVEGQLDQLSILEVQGLKYPVVAVRGSSGAKKEIERALPWLLGWKYVVLGLDMDEGDERGQIRGKEATQEIIKLLEPGGFKVIDWRRKDANEVLLKDGRQAITDAIWGAREIVPPRAVTIKDILPKILMRPQIGDSMPWESLSKVMYGGTRGGEIITVVAASGIGKTCFIKDIIFHKLKTINVGYFSFEHSTADSGRRFAGAQLGLKLHKPGTIWNEELITATLMDLNEKIWMYDKEGAIDVNDMFYHMLYLVKAKNCKLFVIDNLKALNVTLKKETLVNFMNRMKSFVKDHNVDVILVSHVNRDSIHKATNISFNSAATESHKKLTQDEAQEIMNKFSLDWATGRMPNASNIEGGNDIEALSDYVLYMARNKESTDKSLQRTLQIKVGKCGRIDSEYSGLIFRLYYDDSGAYVELKQQEVF